MSSPETNDVSVFIRCFLYHFLTLKLICFFIFPDNVHVCKRNFLDIKAPFVFFHKYNIGLGKGQRGNNIKYLLQFHQNEQLSFLLKHVLPDDIPRLISVHPLYLYIFLTVNPNFLCYSKNYKLLFQLLQLYAAEITQFPLRIFSYIHRLLHAYNHFDLIPQWYIFFFIC